MMRGWHTEDRASHVATADRRAADHAPQVEPAQPVVVPLPTGKI